jgi:hypothetical protein
VNSTHHSLHSAFHKDRQHSSIKLRNSRIKLLNSRISQVNLATLTRLISYNVLILLASNSSNLRQNHLFIARNSLKSSSDQEKNSSSLHEHSSSLLRLTNHHLKQTNSSLARSSRIQIDCQAQVNRSRISHNSIKYIKASVYHQCPVMGVVLLTMVL